MSQVSIACKRGSPMFIVLPTLYHLFECYTIKLYNFCLMKSQMVFLFWTMLNILYYRMMTMKGLSTLNLGVLIILVHVISYHLCNCLCIICFHFAINFASTRKNFFTKRQFCTELVHLIGSTEHVTVEKQAFKYLRST